MAVQYRTTLARTTAVAAAVLMITILTIGRSDAAFNDLTDNNASSISTGSVDIVDDDSGTVLFNLSDLRATDSSSNCIVVTYQGSLTPTAVRLYGSTTGTLDTYLDTTIEIGSGGSFGDCTGFTPSSTLFNNTLENFSTNHSDWATGIAAFSPASTPTSQTFRITVTVQDDNNAQSLTSTASLVWEVQS